MKNLLKSLADFQQAVPVIFKDSQAYGYKYADLPAILEVINPLLKEHGLGFSQPIDGQKVRTILFHVESGETIESVTDIPQGVQLKGMNDFQVLGSAITYIRRYALSSMLGLVTDKDNDAAGEQEKGQKTTEQTPEPKQDEKEYLTKDHVKFNECLEAVKGKYTVGHIEKKYKLSPEAARLLKEAEAQKNAQ